MKAKKIIKAFKKIRGVCFYSGVCRNCPFNFPASDNQFCAIKTFNSKTGWEAFQIGAKEAFND